MTTLKSRRATQSGHDTPCKWVGSLLMAYLRTTPSPFMSAGASNSKGLNTDTGGGCGGYCAGGSCCACCSNCRLSPTRASTRKVHGSDLFRCRHLRERTAPPCTTSISQQPTLVDSPLMPASTVHLITLTPQIKRALGRLTSRCCCSCCLHARHHVECVKK